MDGQRLQSNVPQRERRYFDVAAPGRMPQTPTSRPVVARPQAVVDPMMARSQPTMPVQPAQPTPTPVQPVLTRPIQAQPQNSTPPVLNQQPSPVAQAQPSIASPAVATDPLRQVTTPQPIERPAPLPPKPVAPAVPKLSVAQEDQELLTTLPVDLPETKLTDTSHLLEASSRAARSRKFRPLQWVLLIFLVLVALGLLTAVGFFVQGMMNPGDSQNITSV